MDPKIGFFLLTKKQNIFQTRKTRDRFELQRWDRQLVAALKVDIDSLALQFCAKDQHDLSLDRFGELFMSMELYTIFLGQLSNSDLVEVWSWFFWIKNRMFGLTNIKNYITY